MFEKFRSAALALSVFVILLGIGAYVMVQMGGGDKLFGGKDGSLPPVDFGTLDRSFDDPSFLLCAKDVCPNADVDGPAPRFEVDAQALRLAIVDFADNMPTVSTFRFDPMNNQFDFTERLPGESLPSVITVRITDVDGYTSTLAIYSRTPVGNSSAADHEKRVTRWLRMIETRLGQ
ncbi:hypothetical protein [Kordiimonas aestuarii]|uniref:hypothetical protein n=1 Tax=Kordiimonas aestuarii TaxID=1005925 RepID=UPI0021D147C3|nr:hypothetical protein [Kordiimonas aestuarii]